MPHPPVKVVNDEPQSPSIHHFEGLGEANSVVGADCPCEAPPRPRGLIKNLAAIWRRWAQTSKVKPIQDWSLDQKLSNDTPQALVGQAVSKKKQKNANSTWGSQAVTHPSTNQAQCCLTSVIGRELVFSTWYGRCRERMWKVGYLNAIPSRRGKKITSPKMQKGTAESLALHCPKRKKITSLKMQKGTAESLALHCPKKGKKITSFL